MVFQLADVLNKMNGNDSTLAVNFIPWIQSSPNVPANSNGYRLPNGRIPSVAQLAQIRASNSSLIPAALRPANYSAEIAEHAEEAVEELIGFTPEQSRKVATNLFTAHKDAIDRGLFQWSEAAFLRYQLNLTADMVDFIGGSGNSPLWGEWYDSVYFAASTWRTIDKGLESLPRAFLPHVQDRLTLGDRKSVV